MVLFLHNRYRSSGGEERVVEDLLWLVREHVGEEAELLERRSAAIGRARAAAGLLRGGLQPQDVAQAVRRTGARVVHAHNLHPAFGWRALAAARAAGARVVLQLHQYRLVCAIGVCFTRGAECTRCHGRDTLPGVRLNCRDNVPEAIAYGAGLALWQRRLVAQADAVVVPSAFARERLQALGAPLPWDRVHVLAPPVRALAAHTPPPPAPASPHPAASAPPGSAPTPPHSAANAPPGSAAGAPPGSATYAPSHSAAAAPVSTRPTAGRRRGRSSYALVVSRLSPEKGVDVAIDACRIAGMPLVVAGDGPQRDALRARAGDGQVRFVGRVDDSELAALRAGAALALVPSRCAETFALAAAEAMAVGLPVAASRVGALPELVAEEGLVAPGDARALAQAIERLTDDGAAGARASERVRALCAPETVAGALTEVYAGAEAAHV